MLRANLLISAFNGLCYCLGSLVLMLVIQVAPKTALNLAIIIGLIVFGLTFAVVGRMQHG